MFFEQSLNVWRGKSLHYILQSLRILFYLNPSLNLPLLVYLQIASGGNWTSWKPPGASKIITILNNLPCHRHHQPTTTTCNWYQNTSQRRLFSHRTPNPSLIGVMSRDKPVIQRACLEEILAAAGLLLPGNCSGLVEFLNCFTNLYIFW